MRNLRSTIFSILFLSATVTFGQFGAPTIIGQKPLSTDENVPITIEFGDLYAVDLTDIYPIGFSMTLYSGKNYTFEGTTVTPKDNYHGTLTVPVSVNDGDFESKKFDLKITVNEVDNFVPVITGQVPLSVVSGQSLTIDLAHLIVTDPDNIYPDDFTLKVFDGKNFSVTGTTVTPDDDFVGTLSVSVTVDDGQDESDKFKIEIDVLSAPNVPPVITGQRTLAIDEDQNISIELSFLEVTDPDNNYPKDFTLTIYDGDNYTWAGNTVTPRENFDETLTVMISVFDGEDESELFPLIITVRPVNDEPVIVGQVPLSTYVDTPITVSPTDLTVDDPDNTYPDDFTMKISNGFNYKVDGNTITPASNFIGVLSVKVTVDDGSAQSDPFFMEIRVLTAPNVPPVIVGQQPNISITQGSSLLVSLSHLIVVDPDNSYPKDFTLLVLNGSNYTVAGTTITPSPAFIGTLSVRVRVNDGTVNSAVYNLLVEVVPTTVTPQIIGQQPLIMNEDESITIQFNDLIVSDADDTYPVGFTLQVLTGPSYTVANRTVTPAKNLNGFLNVGVKVADDDGNQSEAFNLVILINSVNDAPVITSLETLPLSYEPGTEPIPISTVFEVEDVDNDHLNLAEVSVQAYTKGFDELLFTNTPTITGFFDVDLGKLVLIGYATLEQYQDAIRSVQYNYALNLEEQGSPGVLPESRTLFIQLNDGQLASEIRSRKINMETNVDLDIPSAFTPNGDGANETWNVYALSNAHQCEDAIIKVYNKRGFLLFQTVGLERQWDGTYNGEKLPVDTYFYTIDLKLSYAKRTYTGVVTLLR